MDIKSKKLEKSQIEITFELTSEEFERHFEHALSHMKSHVKVDGFRPGQAPNKLVEEKIKPESLLMEAGDHAVRHVYSDYVKDNNLEPIGQPEVKIVKIAKGNPFIFTAVITVLPDVELPENYKEIAKKIIRQSAGKEISVTEEEVQDSLKYLQKSRAKMTLKNEPAEKGDFVEINYENRDINAGKSVRDHFVLGEGGFIRGFEDAIVGMKAGEKKIFEMDWQPARHNAEALGGEKKSPAESPSGNQAGKIFKVKLKSVQKMELPEINDEFAKGMGNFDTLVTLKQSMKEGIIIEKTEQEKQRKRGEILEKISGKVKVELPESMVDYEKQRLMEDLKNKVTQNMKITFEQYLSAVKQTEEALTQTFQKEAEKRLKGFLVLRELGKRENIEVSDAEVEEEVSKSTKNEFDIEQLKEYTKGVIFNEKIFQMLEKLSH